MCRPRSTQGDNIAAMIRKGATVAAVMKRFDVKSSTVYSACRTRGVAIKAINLTRQPLPARTRRSILSFLKRNTIAATARHFDLTVGRIRTVMKAA